MIDSEGTIRQHLLESAEVQQRTGDACAADIAVAAELIASAIAGGGKILLCGNGGSAADCQHMAAEFVSRLTIDFERPGIPAIALTTDSSFLTAFANDIGFDGVFARQVETLGRHGDVLVGISTSGTSKNVLSAFEVGHRRGLKTVALTGAAGVQGCACDAVIAVQSLNTQHIQECHLAIEHVLCHLVERRLYPQRGTGESSPVSRSATGRT